MVPTDIPEVTMNERKNRRWRRKKNRRKRGRRRGQRMREGEKINRHRVAKGKKSCAKREGNVVTAISVRPNRRSKPDF